MYSVSLVVGIIEEFIVGSGLTMKTAFLFTTLLLLSSAAHAEEPTGDGKLIAPYPGSTFVRQETKDFEEFEIPLGPRGTDGKLTRSQKLRGRWTSLTYKAPQGRSDLEMGTNYEEGLGKGGFEIRFKCRRMPECGERGASQPGLAVWPYRSSNYFAATKRENGEEIWVALDATENWTYINVVRVKAMEAGLVTVNAAALKKGILDEGHVAVYGILFDTGKSELKPESAAALSEIARLLKENPELKIYVVGHTDHVGGLDSNMALARSRAAAVVRELTGGRYGIAADRLSPQGVGPLVPVATNKTEEGRAKNRRVDLVEQ